MKIICMFGQRRHDPDLIELMTAWDEYCAEDNYEGFEEACQVSAKSWGDDLLSSRVIEIEIDESKIHERFATPTLKGTIG